MSKLKVRDLMTTQLVTLQPTDTVKKAAIKFAVDNISGAPVVDNRNHLLGILSENDILNTILKYQIALDDENHDSVILTYSMEGMDPETCPSEVPTSCASCSGSCASCGGCG